MSDLKCSFCSSEDEDRKYLTSDDGTACVCSNCAMMLTQYVLQEREEESKESQSSNNEAESVSEDDKNIKFQDYLVALEDKWMEKNVINSYVLDAGGRINLVTFRFEDEDEGDDFYFVCELEVEDIDVLPEDVEQNILNEIEWAFDEIREDLESDGLNLDSYLGEKILLKPFGNSNASDIISSTTNVAGAITEGEVFQWMEDGYDRECDPASDAIAIAKNADLSVIFQTLRVYLNYLIEKSGQHEDYVRDSCSSLIAKNSSFKDYFIEAYKYSHDSEMSDADAKEAINSEYTEFALDDLTSYFAYQEVDNEVLFKFIYKFLSCLKGDERANLPTNTIGIETQVIENKMKEVFLYLLDAD